MGWTSSEWSAYCSVMKLMERNDNCVLINSVPFHNVPAHIFHEGSKTVWNRFEQLPEADPGQQFIRYWTESCTVVRFCNNFCWDSNSSFIGIWSRVFKLDLLHKVYSEKFNETKTFEIMRFKSLQNVYEVCYLSIIEIFFAKNTILHNSALSYKQGTQSPTPNNMKIYF